MEYTVEFNVHDFPFWGGAADRVAMLDYDGREALGDFMEVCFGFYDDAPTMTEINDFVWFDVRCFETCHGAPQCGVGYEFCLDVEAYVDENKDDYEMGYCRLVF